MHPYLTSLALKHFPRQPVPGVYPNTSLEEYIKTGQTPPFVWGAVTLECGLTQLKSLLTPPMLDALFAHIQASVDRDHFPSGVGQQSQEWFRHIFPHCSRGGYVSCYANDSALHKAHFPESGDGEAEESLRLFGREWELVQYRLTNPTTLERGAFEGQIEKWYMEHFTQEQRAKWVSPRGGLIRHNPKSRGPYHLIVPNLKEESLCHFQRRYYKSPLDVPHINIWNRWIADFQSSVQDIEGFPEIRDFCYSVERLLADPETPAVQRDYLTSWIARMSTTIL